jgi:hypothetical protein
LINEAFRDLTPALETANQQFNLPNHRDNCGAFVADAGFRRPIGCCLGRQP